MKSTHDNKSFYLLFFLALFGLSVGIFDNYRELWMSANNIDGLSISHIISVSYIVTVLVLFYFTVRVSTNKIKWGMVITLLLNMISKTILVCLNNSGNLFLIKFFMFFDIAFTNLILASIYPLMMNVSKNDLLYTKKEFVESLFSKLGFLIGAIILGKTLFSTLIDYNICLLLSIIFNFLAFIVLISIKLENKNTKSFSIKETISYFNSNKVIYLFLLVTMLSDVIWSSILGMPMLLLTSNLSFSSNFASYFILFLSIASSFLAMLIVKYFRFKNDLYNLFIKFGIRVLLYILIFITSSKMLLIFTLVYLFLTNKPYGFIFSSYFINNIREEHSLFLTTLKYCFSMLGCAIGVFICGLVFNLSLRLFILPVIIISILHFVLSLILLNKRELLIKK